MQSTRVLLVAMVLLLASSIVAAEPDADAIRGRFDRVKSAIEEGREVPERDLAAIIDLLRAAKEDDARRDIVSRLESLGDADGSAPSAVKKYLVENAGPLLVALAKDRKNSSFLRGDAIHALRDMGASRAVLQDVVTMALADSDSYVQSRGEIVQNYIASMPEDTGLSAIKSVDAAKEREALAYLASQRLGASFDQLRDSAMDTNAEAVAALLAAGVDPNAGPSGDSPLVRVLTACSQNGETEAVLKTLDVLLGGGADVHGKDDNNNTPLMTAAQYCRAGAIGKLLAAGADIHVTNGSGVNPLAMALIMSNLDGAELLASKGAKLAGMQLTMVSGATDPRAKKVIEKARKK